MQSVNRSGQGDRNLVHLWPATCYGNASEILGWYRDFGLVYTIPTSLRSSLGASCHVLCGDHRIAMMRNCRFVANALRITMGKL